LACVDGGLDEHLRDRLTILGEVVIAQRIRFVRVVEEDDLPFAGLRLLGDVKLGRISPDRNEVALKLLGEGRDQFGQVDAQRRFGEIDESDRRKLSLIERSGPDDHVLLRKMAWEKRSHIWWCI